MSKFISSHFLAPVVALAIAITASLACGDTTTERLQEAAEEPTSIITIAEPTTAPTGDVGVETEPTSTLPPSPTATPVPEAEAIQVVAQGFSQDERDLGFGFLVENPNAGLAFENSQYQIAAYDDADTVLETDSGYIELILPGQTLGVAGTMWLDEGVMVSKLEVQLLEGDSTPTEPIPTFEVESSTYYAGEYSAAATGIINSPYSIPLQDIRVSAIAYDSGGEIIGGGFTYLNFILANGSTGVEVSVTTSGDVATVELYPTVTGLTFLWEETELPEGASAIALAKQGFGQDDQEIGFGMLVENPNGNFAIEDSQYHITAFAEDGHVLATEEGYVEIILPNQILGIAGTIYLIEDADVARVDAQILAGDFVESDPLPYFSAENVTYQPDEYIPQVTGQIVSPYSKDITDVRVSAILYNEAGEIIGGGFTYLDFAPANGKAAVEVSVTSSSIPATTELYATVSGLSEFE
jgi:hypothetical protein